MSAPPESAEKNFLQQCVLGVGLLFILIAIGAGFYVSGGPQTQRLRRLDDVRVSRLGELKLRIQNFYELERHLPDTLTALSNLGENQADPETREPFIFKKTAPQRFELCATFALSTLSTERHSRSSRDVYRGPDALSIHPKGFHCFRFDYKPSVEHAEQSGTFELVGNRHPAQ